jgi:hypothetical protein
MLNGVDSRAGGSDIRTFVRNRYFYGKLLDVCHFESEQEYFNDKRWILNRLVTGYGVVCGLNVTLTDDSKQLCVDPGVAIDKAGREIVVPVRSKPVRIPEAAPVDQVEKQVEHGDDDEPGQEDEDHRHNIASVYICYHECPGEPEPVRVSDCDDEPPCSDGSIRERYTIEIRPCHAPEIHTLCDVQDLIQGGRLNYKALADYVTNSCGDAATDCCIPLAEIKVPAPGKTACDDDVDITVRPIVYTNDLLFELMLGLNSQIQNRPRGGKS